MRARLLAVFASLLFVAALAARAEARINPQNAGLQVALRAWGVYFGPIDAIAGPSTARAVRLFQRRVGLPVDGIPGRATRRAMGRLGRPLYGRRMLRRGMVGWDVSVLQFLLTRRGSPTGIVDGYFGRETARALRRFQRRRGLAADGVAGRSTRIALTRARPAARARSPDRRATRRYVRARINHWARHYGVSGPFARAVAWVESGFQPHVVSRARARGVMQVRPTTWRYVETVLVGHRIPHTTDGNIRVGVAFLHQLLREFDGRMRRALAAYQQGPRSFRRHGAFRETRRFVRNVWATIGRV